MKSGFIVVPQWRSNKHKIRSPDIFSLHLVYKSVLSERTFFTSKAEMALQDACGFMDYLDDIPPCHHLPNERGSLFKTTSEFETDSPFHFLSPPQQNSGKHGAPSLLSPTFPCLSPHQRPFQLSHGTTTLGFTFQGGVIAAADTRASCKGLICCPISQKIMPIHSHLVVTTSGSGADCMLWERILTREMRLYQLRHRRRLTVNGAAKLLSMMLHPFKGTEVCVAVTLCGWDGEDAQITFQTGMKMGAKVEKTMKQDSQDPMKNNAWSSPKSEMMSSTNKQSDQSTLNAIWEKRGPRVCYVCSDGLKLRGEIISVGSGSPYAYAVLDDGWRWGMTVDEAMALAREAVFRATHWDAYSGNNVDLFHITALGLRRRDREDLKEEYYREKERAKKMIKEREKERQIKEKAELAEEAKDIKSAHGE